MHAVETGYIYGKGRKRHDSESEPIRYDTTDRGRGKVTYI
jgi:hypothetical protein